MSSKGASFKAPATQTVEEPQVVEEDQEEVKQRTQKAQANMGRAENILAGIQMMLKDRLGK